MNDSSEDDISALKHQIELLQERLMYSDQLEALRREVATSAADRELKTLGQSFDYTTALTEFKAEVRQQFSYFKWIAWTGGVLFALLGFFGLKGWNDITKAADTLLSKQLGDMSEKYSNLSRAFSLQDSGRSAEALPYLKALYELNHYDEPIVRAYLEALGNLNQCDEILSKYTELASVKQKFESIKDPNVFNTIGYTIRDCYSDIPNAVPLAKQMLDKSLRRFSSFDPYRRYPLFNLATLSFIENDLGRARKLLVEAATIVDGYPEDANTIKRDTWFKALLQKRPTAEREFDKLWAIAMKARSEMFAKANAR